MEEEKNHDGDDEDSDEDEDHDDDDDDFQTIFTWPAFTGVCASLRLPLVLIFICDSSSPSSSIAFEVEISYTDGDLMHDVIVISTAMKGLWSEFVTQPMDMLCRLRLQPKVDPLLAEESIRPYAL